MSNEGLQSGGENKKAFSTIRWLYDLLAMRSYSAIMFGALFCTLAVKLFHSWRTGLPKEYFEWILADISVLLGVEVIFAIVCFRWPRKWVIRIATFAAALICTWSVINAGWLIRTGTQILPRVLLPLFRDPLSSFKIIGINLIKMPKAAVMLLGPSAVALSFLFWVLAKPKQPVYNKRRFVNRITLSIIIVLTASLLHEGVVEQSFVETISEDLIYNAQLKAITSLLLPDFAHPDQSDFTNVTRRIPAFDQVEIAMLPGKQKVKFNVVIVVLEGVQYKYTSLHDRESNLTPYLASLAKQGVEFTNARSTLSHTTKALFAILTGRYPAAYQDIVEAVPVVKPYASIATILEQQLNFRTAFFHSAEGRFECSPGQVYNLGFDKFRARENLNDPNAYLGYFNSDEFAMLKPLVEWIKADEKPFLLTIMCSVTHDPYVVPRWYAEPAKEPVDRYRQAISYTDKFLATLDEELGKLNLADKTVFCVISDHGEAFGEHGGLAHERIAFDEVLHVPWVIRAPSLIEPGKKVVEPVSSVDVTPTLLSLFGFDTKTVGFNGTDGLGTIPQERKVYFSGWMQEGPAGYVQDSRKYIYNPINKIVFVYDLNTDPLELNRVELPEQEGQKIAEEIIAWRKGSIFQINQFRTGKKVLFDHWLCHWTNRSCSARYQEN
jgi:hypothetical protein